MGINLGLVKAIRKTKLRNQFWRKLDQVKVEAPCFGGCLMCARAILQVVGKGELIRIVSDMEMRTQTEHYGALIDEVIYDFDGGYTSANKWITHLELVVNLRGRHLRVVGGHDPYSEIVDDQGTAKVIAGMIQQSLSKVF